MPLSANTVFHFTEERDNLEGILEQNFKIHYCKETIFVHNQTIRTYVPMVSFCDIPLSQIKNHIKSYGPYGIGLRKEWAIRNNLNPVIYMEKDSFLSHSFDLCFDLVVTSPEGRRNKQAFFDIFRYMKNYQGDLVRRDKRTKKKYRFSDEREWRYVPLCTKDFPMFITESVYEDEIIEANHKLEKERLSFAPKDIEYIIVKNDREIHSFLDHIHLSKSPKYSEKAIALLKTKIITVKKIEGDI